MIQKRGVPIAALVFALLARLAFDNLLLLRFLGMGWALLAPLGLAVLAVLAALLRASPITPLRIAWRTLATCALVALAVLLLGGEGRWVYANPDWQIRDAVLADLATHRWPFAYAWPAGAMVLRAPLAMYLLPALAGGARAHDTALLASNAVTLALVFALGSALFDTMRRRLLALGVFLVFSGWDALGLALRMVSGLRPAWDHIENWNGGFQYSSTLTLAFWVPNHAFSGWIAAVLFLLWRRGLLPIGVFAAALPLLALWSPLALIGAAPFAMLAGVVTLARRRLQRTDIALAAVTLAVALPALLYLQADAARVGAGLVAVPPAVLLLLLAFEVAPFAVPVLRARGGDGVIRATDWLVLACLVLMPLWGVGQSLDFQMRASIMPLALLALAFADWIADRLDERPGSRVALTYAAVALAIGAATPALELCRALIHSPSPPPLCSLEGVWTRQSGLVVSEASYFARTTALPAWLGPFPVTAGGHDPANCWDRPWYQPRL